MRSRKGIVISQKKYTLEIIEDINYLALKPASSHMEQNLLLRKFVGDYVSDPSSYRRLIGRLIYLRVTWPDLTYAVHTLSQFIDKPRIPHLKAAQQIICHIKQMPGQGLFFPSNNSS